MSPFMTDNLGTDFEEGKKKVEARNPTNFLYTTHVDEDYGDDVGGGDKTPKNAGSARKGISNFFAKIRVSTGSKELMATDQENEVMALNEYVTEVEAQTKTLVKATDALVKHTADVAATYDEMGVPIGEWRTTFQQQSNGSQAVSIAICCFGRDLL